MSKEQLGSVVGDRFVVKGPFPSAAMALVVLGGTITIVGGLVAGTATQHRAFALGNAVLGVLLLGAGLFVLVTKRRRWQIALHEQGAVFDNLHGVRTEVVFADLAAISHEPKPRYNNGVYAGVGHRLRLWRKEDPPKQPLVEIDCYLSDKKCREEAQAMQALANAASAAISRRLEAIITGGGTAKSPGGLQLDATALRYQGTSLPLAEIADIGVYDGKFCVWEKGKEFATLKLDPAEANILPIMDLVGRRMAEHQAEEARVEANSLGRVLFERRSSKAIGWLCVVIGAPLCPLLVGIPIVLLGLSLVRSYFRCHERGVSQHGLRKARRLLYSEVASFTYSATRMYVNGVYAGTTLAMKFGTDDPKVLPPIKFSASVSKVDEDLDELRDRISAVVAQRLLRQHEETGAFSWTKALEVTKDAIRYRKGKFIGLGDWVELPFDRYLNITIDQGVFHLFSKDAEKSVFDCPISEPNFFPGLHAFLDLVAPPHIG